MYLYEFVLPILPRPQTFRRGGTAAKISVSIFWDEAEIVLLDFCQQGKISTRTYIAYLYI